MKTFDGYFMGYENTKKVVLWWYPTQPNVIKRARHVYFDKIGLSTDYNPLSPGSTLLQRKHDNHNLPPFELIKFDWSYTPFDPTSLYTYHLQLYPKR